MASPASSSSGGPDLTRSSAPSRSDSRANPRTSSGVADTPSSKRSSMPKPATQAKNLISRTPSFLTPNIYAVNSSTAAFVADDASVAQQQQQQQQRSGLESWQASGKVWLQQIEKDLPRTFPDHSLMRDHGSKTTSGRCALRRILAAYSLHNPGVGYCQGMNFIAGCLLLFMNEEDAFYCLCTIVGEILAGYYSVNMMATQVCWRRENERLEQASYFQRLCCCEQVHPCAYLVSTLHLWPHTRCGCPSVFCSARI